MTNPLSLPNLAGHALRASTALFSEAGKNGVEVAVKSGASAVAGGASPILQGLLGGFIAMIATAGAIFADKTPVVLKKQLASIIQELKASIASITPTKAVSGFGVKDSAIVVAVSSLAAAAYSLIKDKLSPESKVGSESGELTNTLKQAKELAAKAEKAQKATELSAVKAEKAQEEAEGALKEAKVEVKTAQLAAKTAQEYSQEGVNALKESREVLIAINTAQKDIKAVMQKDFEANKNLAEAARLSAQDAGKKADSAEAFAKATIEVSAQTFDATINNPALSSAQKNEIVKLAKSAFPSQTTDKGVDVQKVIKALKGGYTPQDGLDEDGLTDTSSDYYDAQMVSLPNSAQDSMYN